MIKLPGAEAALIDLGKLRDYILNPAHPRGRHKARVMRRALGIGLEDAAWLREEIMDRLSAAEAVHEGGDVWGERWRVDLVIERQGRIARLRTIWLIRAKADPPRLVTCYVPSLPKVG